MEIKTFYAIDFPENCYSLNVNGEIALIDPGEFTAELCDFVTENSDSIKYILLTHMHFDHICATADVKKLCPSAKIVIHTADAEGLNNPQKSLAAYFGFNQKQITADILCENDDVLKIGNKDINIMHTPGHSEGGVCYIIDNAIFCGDTIFEGSCGRTDFPGGSGQVLAQSLKKLKALKGDYTLYPGHGNPTTLENERNYNPYMRNL